MPPETEPDNARPDRGPELWHSGSGTSGHPPLPRRNGEIANEVAKLAISVFGGKPFLTGRLRRGCLRDCQAAKSSALTRAEHGRRPRVRVPRTCPAPRASAWHGHGF